MKSRAPGQERLLGPPTPGCAQQEATTTRIDTPDHPVLPAGVTPHQHMMQEDR